MIYFEIIELHFCHLDRHFRRSIIKRVQDEKKELLKEVEKSEPKSEFEDPDKFI